MGTTSKDRITFSHDKQCEFRLEPAQKCNCETRSLQAKLSLAMEGLEKMSRCDCGTPGCVCSDWRVQESQETLSKIQSVGEVKK
jgi:hypothetical protein